MTQTIIIVALSFIAGALHGTREATINHWTAFQARFPHVNPMFWNPALSWLRPQYLGYKFDFYHMGESMKQWCLIGIGFLIAFGTIRPMWQYILGLTFSFGAYILGNYLVEVMVKAGNNIKTEI